MNRVLLDTSILIGSHDPGDLEGAISAASLATAPRNAPRERSRRAAAANVHGVPMLTADTADLAIIDDLVDVQAFPLTRRPRSDDPPPARVFDCDQLLTVTPAVSRR